MATKKENVTKKKIKKVECPKCGKLNSLKAKFCIACGAKLEPIAPPVKEPKPDAKETIQSKSKDSGTLILGKFRPRFFIIIGVIVVAIIAGAYFLTSNHTSTQPLAPNNTNASTKFAACTSSSQCSAGDYCSNFGACLPATCGDGICTTQERQSNSCPIDCGCGAGTVLNRHLDECQPSINVSQSTITAYISKWLTQNNETGSITSINDTYYSNQTVEEAVVNCQLTNQTYPCSIVFYFNQTGNVINVIRSS